MTKLNAKQQAFVDEYCIDKNATQAAIRAGYSEKTAKEIGCENLTKPNIRAAIDEKLKEHAQRCDVTVDQIAFNIQRIANRAEETDELHTALKGQMDLAKLLGLVVDKSESKNEHIHSGEVGHKIEFIPVGPNGRNDKD